MNGQHNHVVTTSDHVWYASYGSNLLRRRFELYLLGGSLPGGRERADHVGARDASLPVDDRAGRVPHALRFAGSSARWGGGGVAFLDPEVGSGSAVVRMYRVTAEQFADIAAQENGLNPGDVSVDIDALRQQGWLDLGRRWYGRALYCGDVDGAAVVTFTAHHNVEPTAAPHHTYADVVGRGLVECGLTVAEAVDYLLAADGVGKTWNPATLTNLLAP